MEIIFDAIEERKADLEAKKMFHKFPFGLKVIYCVPRSFLENDIYKEINACIILKKGIRTDAKPNDRKKIIEKRKKIGEPICSELLRLSCFHFSKADLLTGFDFVGTEDRGNSENHQKAFPYFKKRCDEAGVEIPFMFHVGETLLDTRFASSCVRYPTSFCTPTETSKATYFRNC